MLITGALGVKVAPHASTTGGSDGATVADGQLTVDPPSAGNEKSATTLYV